MIKPDDEVPKNYAKYSSKWPGVKDILNPDRFSGIEQSEITNTNYKN